MTDLVERLRSRAAYLTSHGFLEEADVMLGTAAEIVRLNARLDEACLELRDMDKWQARAEKAEAELERIRISTVGMDEHALAHR